MPSIDNRVVEMEFDNNQFNNGVSSTVKQLDNLKKSLKFDDYAKSFTNLEKSANKFNLSGLASSVETIASRFSTLGIIGVTALQRITNAAISTGTSLVKNLSLDAVMGGFQEYETQMNSILTILNNTKAKGSTLDDVNAALNELNTYADQTIYNFTEMTQNIGRFTAAGVDLQTSVDSIKGLSNLAAFFGSSSQQASSAMYQLSQAIAAGKVQLMDWNSVVNAGMGGPEFQDALKRTAEHFGKNVDGMIKKYGSFRESLTKGEWLTSDVLTETLKQISGAYSEADLIAQGYSEDQAKAIVQLANDATDAATKVRTFTQLMSTIQEQMGSGWTTSWQLIEGDFNEATNNWSSLYDKLGTVIQKSSDQRNALLQEWANLGGRTELWAGLNSMFDTLLSYIDAIKKGFQTIFPPATAQQLYDFTKGFHEFWQNAVLTEEEAEKLSGAVSDFASVLKWVIDGFTGATEGIHKFLEGAGVLQGGFIDLLSSIGEFVKGLTNGIDLSGAFSFVLSGLGDVMSGVGRMLTFIGTGVSMLASAFSGALSNMTQAIGNLSGGLGAASQGITEIILTLIEKLPDAIGTAISAIGDAVDQILDSVPIKEINSTLQDTLFTLILNNIRKFTSGLNESTDPLQGIFDNIADTIEKLGNVLDGAKNSIKAFTNSIQANVILKIAIALGILAASLKVLSDIPVDNLVASLGALATGMIIMGAAGIGMIAILKKIAGSLKGALELTVLASNVKKIALSMVLFAAAIKIVSSALRDLGEMKPEQLFQGIVALIALSGVVVGITKVMQKMQGFGKAAGTLIIFSAAVAILSASLHSLAELSLEQVATGLLAIAGSAGILIGASKAMQKGASTFVKSSVALLLFSGAVAAMAKSMKAFNDVQVGDIIKSVGALAAVMGIMKLFSKSMKGIKIQEALSTVAVMITYGEALKSFSESAKAFNDVDFASIGKLGVIVGVLMAELYLFTKKMQGTKVIEIAGALIAISESVKTFAESVQLFKDMSPEEIAKGLIAIAGGLAIMLTAMHKLPKEQMAETSLGFAIIAFSLKAFANAIKEFGTMDLESIGRALLVFAGSMTILTVAANKLTGTASGSGSFALFALGLSLLVGPIKMLGDMKIDQLAQAIVALAAVLGIVYVACQALSKINNDILKTSVSLVALGAAITVFGIGLTAMLFPIKQLAELDNTQLSQGVVSLVAVIGVLFALSNTMNALPDMSVKTVAKVALMASVIAGVGAVLGQLAQIDSQAALQAALALSGTLIATTAALKVLDTVNIAGAAKAIGTMAIIIAGMSAIVAAAGGIAQIPGAQWLVGEGASFLQSIGAAIGGFFGGIAGGVAAGAMNVVGGSLPAFGQSLSDFMTNAQPFFTGMQGIGGEAVNGVKSLAEAMVYLTGADILNAATSWLTGGSSLVGFGKQLAEFAPYFITFAGAVSVIDAGKVTASANAAKALAEFANSIPSSGGLLQKITGENDIVKFGAQLALFGPSMAMYAGSIADIDADKVTASANAAKVLAEFAQNLPETGGLLQKITGENDIEQFGKAIRKLGPAIASFGNSVKDVSAENITNATNAAQAISDLANSLPETGGGLQWLMGEKDLGGFAENIKSLGEGIKSYCEAVSGATFDNVEPSLNAMNTIADISSKLDESGGLNEIFTGKRDLGAFAGNLSNLGAGIAAFMTSIAEVKFDNSDAALNAMSTIADISNKIEETGGASDFWDGSTDYSGFADGIEDIGNGIKAYANAVSGAKFDNIDPSLNAFSSLIDVSNKLDPSGGLSDLWEGKTDLNGFATGVGNLGEGIKNYANAVSGAKFDNLDASLNGVSILADISNKLNESGGLQSLWEGNNDLSGFATGVGNLGEGIKAYANAVSGAKFDNVDASLNAANTLTTISNRLDKSGGISSLWDGTTDLSSFGTNVTNLGEGIKNFANATAGATFDNVAGAVSALRQLMSIGNQLGDSGGLSDIWEGGTDYNGFAAGVTSMGEAVAGFANNVAGATFDNVSAAVSALNQLKGLVSGSTDINTEGFTAFTDAIKNMGDLGLSQFNEELAASAQNAATSMSAIANAVSGGGGQITAAFSNLRTTLTNQQGLFTVSGQQDAQAFINAIVATINGNQLNAMNSMMTLCNAIIYAAEQVFTNSKDKFKTWGQQMIDSLIVGMNSRKDQVKTSLSNIVSAIKIDNASDKLYTTGQNIIQGLIDGMNNKKKSAGDTAYNIGKNTVNQLNKGASVASPSKEATKTGQWIDQGLINGLNNLRTKVKAAGYSVGDEAVKTLQASASKFSAESIVAMDTQPTIRPVMDLSDVTYGIQTMNMMLNSGTYGISARMSSRMAAEANRYSRTTEPEGPTKVDNTDVVNAINAMGSKIDTLGNQMAQMKVVLDSGALVGNTYSKFDQKLGMQQKYKERGI